MGKVWMGHHPTFLFFKIMADTQNLSLEEVTQKLKDSFVEVQNILSNLTETQVNFKTSEETWSINENLEHIILTGRGILVGIQKTAETNPKLPAMTTDKVIDMLHHSDFKVKAPEMIVPQGKTSWDDLLEDYAKLQKEVSDFLEKNDKDLEKVFFPHPLIGELNGLNWLGFIAGHNLRHGEQIRQIMKAEGFPN